MKKLFISLILILCLCLTSCFSSTQKDKDWKIYVREQNLPAEIVYKSMKPNVYYRVFFKTPYMNFSIKTSREDYESFYKGRKYDATCVIVYTINNNQMHLLDMRIQKIIDRHTKKIYYKF